MPFRQSVQSPNAKSHQYRFLLLTGLCAIAPSFAVSLNPLQTAEIELVPSKMLFLQDAQFTQTKIHTVHNQRPPRKRQRGNITLITLWEVTNTDSHTKL